MRYLLAFVAAVLALWTASAGERPGKDLYERRCTGCHALDRDKSGPRLSGVFGRRAGTVAGFGYSDALRKSAVVWDRANLERWLTDPDSVVPGNDMAFRVKDPVEREAIIEYLQGVAHP